MTTARILVAWAIGFMRVMGELLLALPGYLWRRFKGAK